MQGKEAQMLRSLTSRDSGNSLEFRNFISSVAAKHVRYFHRLDWDNLTLSGQTNFKTLTISRCERLAILAALVLQTTHNATHSVEAGVTLYPLSFKYLMM